MDHRTRRILDQVPGWTAASCRVTTLAGGITNRNFKVERGGEAFVLRIGGEGTEILGIDRRREYESSVIAAACGVGAEVVCFLEAEGAMVTRFIAGSAVPCEVAARPDMLRRIAGSIRRVHAGPPFPGAFSAPDTVRSYQALALKHGVVFPETLPRVFELMGRIEQALGRPSDPVPCHNDLLAANFIDDGVTIRILDWEYAGMGDRFFDLGNFAVNQRLGEVQCEALLEAYFGGVPPRGPGRLHLMMLLSDLRESFWGFLQSGISRLEFDFTKYGLDHLGRFLENARTPAFEGWLRAARE